MSTDLSVADLKFLHEMLTGLAGDCNVNLKLGLADRIARMIAERAGVRGWGDLVFSLTVPLSIEARLIKGKRAGQMVKMHLAPLLNVYAQMEPWNRQRLYREIDVRILGEMAKWPASRLGARPRPRAVRATRYSSVRPDEITVDVTAKVHVDRLVHAGILCGDRAVDLERDARWVSAKPGTGRLTVEVFELI